MKLIQMTNNGAYRLTAENQEDAVELEKLTIDMANMKLGGIRIVLCTLGITHKKSKQLLPLFLDFYIQKREN